MTVILVCGLAFAGPSLPTQAETLIAEGHWKQARDIVEPWHRAKPNDALANFLLSQTRAAFGDRKSPLSFAENAVRLDGNTAKFHRQLAEVAGVTAQYSGLLQQLLLAHRFKKEIEIALLLDPKDLQALRDLMEFYLLAPGVAGGDKSKARAPAERIAQLDAAEGYLALARLAEFNKETAKEEVLLRQAVAAQPRNYKARIALANYYFAAAHRRLDLAEQQAREAQQIDAGRVEAYNVLAAASAARGNWAVMEAVLASAEKAVPDDLTPYYRAAAAILEAHGDAPRAERLLRRYMVAEPEGNAPTLDDARRELARATGSA
jgi:hypothetical protein